MPRAHVVLVHGLRTSATMWRRQLAALARHDVDVVAVDLPGHGTRMDEPFTLDAAMRVIDEAIRRTTPTAPLTTPAASPIVLRELRVPLGCSSG